MRRGKLLKVIQTFLILSLSMSLLSCTSNANSVSSASNVSSLCESVNEVIYAYDDSNEVLEVLNEDETLDEVITEVIDEEELVTEFKIGETLEITCEIVRPYTTRSNLFEKDAKGKYNYCPTVIKEDDTLNIWYCENKTSYEVRDSIYFVSCKLDGDKSYYESCKEVLSSSRSSWDSVHVCDPSVIEGNFNYNGSNYKYLMAYLGCSSLDNQDNQIGIAVSNEKDKGWIKCNNAPLVSFEHDYNHGEFQWGVGQPSLINLNNDYVLLFFTRGTYNLTSEVVRVYDLSNVNNPIVISEAVISNNGTNDFISNADFSISGNTLYMVCDKHPYKEGLLNIIADESNIFKLNLTDVSNVAVVVNDLLNANWTYLAQVNGYSKNHNCGFVRDKLGNLAQSSIVESIAQEKDNFLNSLCTYSLRLTDVNMN